MSGPNTESAIATRAAWIKARAALLAEEKALTRAQDRLAAARRRLPRQPVEFTNGRGVEFTGRALSFLNTSPWGRQVTWQDPPAGIPKRTVRMVVIK